MSVFTIPILGEAIKVSCSHSMLSDYYIYRIYTNKSSVTATFDIKLEESSSILLAQARKVFLHDRYGKNTLYTKLVDSTLLKALWEK